MVNSVVLVGRLTRSPELKKTKSNKSVVSFTVAVDKYGSKEASFIPCVVWEQGAEYLSKYGEKGNIVMVTGELNTRDYEGTNGKVHVVEVNANRVKVLPSAKKQETTFNLNDINVDDEFKDEVFPWQ